MSVENDFEKFMRTQYQWADQFDMDLQYSQLDMQAAFLAGRKTGITEAQQIVDGAIFEGPRAEKHKRITNAISAAIRQRMEGKTMKCPNCNIDLIWHTTDKDVPCAAYTEEHDSVFDIGRVAIMACPKCQYFDESTMRVHFHE